MRHTLKALATAVAVCLAAVPLTAQPSCPAPQIVQTGGPNPTCAGVPVTLDAGAGWASYQWSNGVTTRLMTDSPAATTAYSVTTTDANGCSATSQPFQVQVTAAPNAPAITLSAATICRNASFTASDMSSTLWATRQWSVTNGTVTNDHGSWVDIQPDGNGDVAVTLSVTDTNGCPANTSATATLHSAPQPIIRPYDAKVCPGSPSGAFIETPPNVTWQSAQWSIANGTLSYQSVGGVSFTTDPGGQPATLTVTATDSFGCSATASVTIPVRSIAPPVIHPYEAAVCPGMASGAYIESPEDSTTTWQSVQWSIVNGTIDYQSTGGVSFRTDPGGQPATITATATDSRGCTSTASRTIPVRSIPPPVIHPYEAAVCPGSASGAYLESPADSNTYWQSAQWSIVHGTIDYQSTGGVSFRTDPGGQPATITVVVTDSRGCSNSASATIPVRSIPPPVIRAYEAAVCPGSSSGAFLESPADSSTYWQSAQWSIVHGTITNQSTGGVSFTTDPGGQPATVSVTVTDSRGCSNSASVSIPVRSIPAPVLHAYEAHVCPGSSSGVTIESPAESNTSWQSVQWSIANGTITNQSTSGVSFTTDPSGQPATITAVATDTHGCSSSASITIPVRVLPPPAIRPYNPVVCAGSLTAASVDPPGDASGAWSSIDWSIANGTITARSGRSVEFTTDAGGLPPTLTVTVADALGCRATSSLTIETHIVVPPSIYLDYDAACAGGPDRARVAPAAAPNASWSSIQWTIANGTIVGADYADAVNFTTDASGLTTTLTVVVTDTLGCSTSASLAVPVRTITAPAIRLDHLASCPGAPNRATVGNPNEPGTWWADTRWTIVNGTITGPNTSSSADFTTDPGGQPATITVTLTDNLGCTTTSSATVPLRAITPPSIQFDRQRNCPGAPNRASVGNPSEPGTWWADTRWTIVNGTIIGPNTSSYADFTTDPTGQPATLTVTLTDNLGCRTSASATVPVRAITPPAIRLDKAVSCAGAPNRAAAGNPDEPGTWWADTRWTIVNGTIIGPNTSSYVDFTTDPAGQPATLTVTATDNLGCTTSASITVPVRTITPPAIRLDKPGSCAGAPNRASAGNPSEPGTWWADTRWTIVNGAFTGPNTSSYVDFTTDPAGQPATLTVTATDNLGCTTSASITVPVRTITPPPVYLDFDSVCPGGTDRASVTYPSEPGTWWASTHWTIVNGTITGPDTSSYVDFTTDPGGQPATVTVTLIDNLGCSTIAGATAGVGSPQAPIQLASSPSSFCPNGTVTVSSTDGRALHGYSWSVTGGVIVGAADQSSVTAQAYGNANSLQATLTAQTDIGGCAATGSLTIPLGTLPTPAVTASGPTTFCAGGSVTLTAPAGFAQYLWSNQATTRSITVSAAGSYNVVVIDANGCWARSANVGVTTTGPATPVIQLLDPTTFCAGRFARLRYVAPAGSTILWSTGETNQVIHVVAAGIYTVTVTDANGCSATSAPVVTTVNPNPPTPVVTAGGPTTFCAGGSVTLTAPGGYTYRWSNQATTQSITVSASGNYTVTVTDANGCTASSAATAVTVNPLPAPAITASGPTSFCTGGSVTLTASAAASYAWSNGATTQSITVNASGSYSVTVTGANGCSAASAPVGVFVDPPPAAAISGNLHLCGSGASTTLTAGGGQSYVWSTGAFTQSITVTQPGTYTATVTDSFGCSAAVSATVDSFALTVTPSSATICEGDPAVLSASPAASYLWSTGQTTQSIVVRAAGSYSVTATDANGCSLTSNPVVVTVRARPSVTATLIPPSLCGGQYFTVHGAVTGGSGTIAHYYLWNMTFQPARIIMNSATSPDFTLMAEGNGGTQSFMIEVDDADGCVADSNVVTQTIYPAPAHQLYIETTGRRWDPNCPTSPVTLSVQYPSEYASFSWSSGQTTPSISVTAAGRYTVTATTSNGCVYQTYLDVSFYPMPAKPVITPSGPTSFCVGGSVTLTAPAAASYYWSNGATTQSITVAPTRAETDVFTVRTVDANGCSAGDSDPVVVAAHAVPVPGAWAVLDRTCGTTSATLYSSDNQFGGDPNGDTYLWSNGATTRQTTVTAPGTYHVTITSAYGCTAVSNDVNVVFNAPMNGSIVAQTPATVCPGGSVTVSAQVSGGVPPYTYVWASGDSGINSNALPRTQSITVQPTVDAWLNVDVVDSVGCHLTPSTNLSIDHVPAPAITASGPTTFCAGGSVTLSAPGGYTYAWSNGATTQSIAVSASGSFTVTVTDANGCSAASAATAVTVRPLPTPTITAGGSTTICAGGSVTLTASSASSYAWSNGATTRSITVSAAGSYSVTVTDANGCSGASAAVDVVVQTVPKPAVTASGSTTYCPGGSVTLTAPAGYTYQWSNGATTQSITVSALGDGSYSVTVRDALGCSSTSDPVVTHGVASPSTPGVSTSGPTAFCAGGSVTLTAPGGYTYAWSTGAPTQSITVSSAGAYSVTVTDANGCSASSATTNVVVNSLPPAPAIAAGGPTTFCPGGSVTLTAPAGYSYRWSTFQTAQSITVSSSGSYSVTVTDANGCSAASAVTVVTVNANPPQPAITASGPTTFCTGGSVTLTAPDGYSYQWSNGATTRSITVSSTDNYRVTVTDANGCSSSSLFMLVHAVAYPPATITTSGPTSFCSNDSVTLYAPMGYAYHWSTGATTDRITVSASGTYSVTVYGGYGCDTTSDPVTVTVRPSPATPTITAGGPTTFCAGGSVTLTASPAYAYYWSNGASTQSITVTGAGTYSVSVWSQNGCPATSAPATVTVLPAPPTPAITAGGPTTFCAGGSVTLTAPSGYTYRWSNDATTRSIDVGASGAYSVTVTDANGCGATSAAIAVTVNPLPPTTITAGGPTTFCAGGSVTLTAPSGYSYSWSTGATTQSINATTSDVYSVTVTDANGCSAASSGTSVTVNPPPAVPTISTGGAPTTFCAGGNILLTSSSSSGNQWYRDGTAIAGATANTYTATASGSYTVKVTDANGCTSNASAAVGVTVNQPPAAPTISTGGAPTTFCAGGNILLTSSSSSGNQWYRDGNAVAGATANTYTAAASGSYTVKITDANGCTSNASAAVGVTVNPPPAAPTISTGGAPTTFCAGGNILLTSSSSSGNQWYLDGTAIAGATANTYAATASGSYTVKVTDGNNCTSNPSAPVPVTVYQPPATPTISASGPTTFCTGGSVVLTSSSSSGNQWYLNNAPITGATSNTYTATASGSYTVKVTDAHSCTSNASAATVVTVNTIPATPTITAGGATTFCNGSSVTLTSSSASGNQWYLNGTAIGGATGNTYTAAASGSYTVTVTTSGCTSAASAATVVTENPTITAFGPLTQTVAKNGTPQTLSVTATGPTLKYQWYKGTSGNTSQKASSTTNTFKPPTNATGTFTYWVRVTSGTCTADSATATVTVN